MVHIAIAPTFGFVAMNSHGALRQSLCQGGACLPGANDDVETVII
jgi:hypothetical protein